MHIPVDRVLSDAAFRRGIAHAVDNSLPNVFLVSAPIALAGFLIALLLRGQPLRGCEQPRPQPDAAAGRKPIAA